MRPTNAPKVHRASVDTLARLKPLMAEFSELSGYGDPDVWHVNMQAMMDSDMAESLYITRNDDPDGEPVALMLAYIVPCPFSGETQVWEQAWFVTAGERGQPHAFTLLAALEELAAELGCRHVWMAHLDNKFGERLRHILPRFGYKPHQIYYSKELNHGC